MRRRSKLLIWIAVAAAVLYGIYAVFAPHGNWGGPPQGPTPVSAAEVIERNIRQWHEFSGRLVAVDYVEIRPQVSGVIIQVHFKDGAMVNKGDVLFTIDPRPFVTAYQSANARASLANSNFDRTKKLLAEKAIPQHDFDQRKNDIEVARADLSRAKLDLDYTQVKTPISGRVSRAEITVGNLVETGGNAPILATVVSSNPIYADFDIDEATYLSYVHSGSTGLNDVHNIPVAMALTGEKDASHTGYIQSFDNKLNTTSGTIRVRSVFDNKDSALVPGMFARIRLGTSQDTPALLITDRAIGTDQSKKFVLVVGQDNKVEHREIKLGGISDDGLRIVTDGLKPGEKIIVSGLQRVMMPNQEVKPETVPMDSQKSEAGNQKLEEKKP